MAGGPRRALLHKVAAVPEGRLTRHLHSLAFSRPFRGSSRHRVLVLFEPKRIAYAPVFPFLAYAEAFARRHDAQVRLFPVSRALSHGLPRGLSRPTHVVGQTWLTDPPERHAALARLFGALPDGTVTAYLDSFANTDIRLAGVFGEVDLYFRKALFTEPEAFLRPTYGHTNLTDYYGRLYGLEEEPTDWKVPRSSLRKLRLAPNFLTAPGLAGDFLSTDRVPRPNGREIDLHARLGGTHGHGWYAEMRRHAARAVESLKGVNVVSGTGIEHDLFMQELRSAKICFSPFGFGEVCWRDIEAIAAGAVLLKPGMDHLRTEPDLYRDDETYVACRWDFADVEEKVTALLEDDARRERIARTAWTVARRYLDEDGPVDTYAPLFAV